MPLAVLSGAETDAAGAARTAYHAAQDAEAIPDYKAARGGYAWARDLDPLRFRAPSVFNDSIRELARAHGAALVDVHQAFVDASQHGLIGHNLVLEHVHPNLDGYYLLADAFFDAMVARGVPGTPEVDVPDAVARQEMPVSDVDRWLGEYKVRRIVRHGHSPRRAHCRSCRRRRPRASGSRMDVYEQRMTWPEAQDKLRRYYQSVGNKPEYTRITAILADAFPVQRRHPVRDCCGADRVLGRPADALRYARRALELEPRNVNNLLVSAHALILGGRRDEGRALLEQVLQIDPANPTARKVLAQLGAASPQESPP